MKKIIKYLIYILIILNNNKKKKGCPRDWIEFKGTVSCYKFQRYPLLTVDEAKASCLV